MPGKTNVSRAKKKQQEIADRMERRNFFIAEQGDNEIRILPPWRDDLDWPFFETKNHRLSDRVIYICNKGHDGESFCYTCDVAIPKLFKGSEKDQALASRIKPTDRVFCNILERANEEKGCQLWGISVTNYGQLVSHISDPDYGDITDVKEGTDIILNRTGVGKEKTKYTIRAKRKSSPLNNKAVLKSLYDLDEACGGAPAEEHKRMLSETLGISFDDDDEEDVTETSEEDDSFNFGKDEVKAAPEDEEGEEAEEEEEEDNDDASGELVPIKVPAKLKGTKKKLFLKKSKQQSECFGTLFDENEDVCIEECDCALDCMAIFTSEG